MASSATINQLHFTYFHPMSFPYLIHFDEAEHHVWWKKVFFFHLRCETHAQRCFKR